MTPCDLERLQQKLKKAERQLILATPNPACPACSAERRHTHEERTQYHPDAGKGTVRH